MRVSRVCGSEPETIRLATWLGRQLSGGELVCLEGELGSGKTCFVRGMAAGLGLDPGAVSSPTFIIWRRYDDHARLSLVHVDAFRLNGPQELESVGLEELLDAPDTVVAVEWPDRVGEALPGPRIDVMMGHAGPDARRVTISAPDEICGSWEPPDDG